MALLLGKGTIQYRQNSKIDNKVYWDREKSFSGKQNFGWLLFISIGAKIRKDSWNSFLL